MPVTHSRQKLTIYLRGICELKSNALSNTLTGCLTLKLGSSPSLVLLPPGHGTFSATVPPVVKGYNHFPSTTTSQSCWDKLRSVVLKF